MEKQNYKDLIAWQRGIELVPKVYALLKRFPREENYALADQVRRSVVSVPANIAEGQGRSSRKEFYQYLAIAKGSLAELHTLLIVAQRLGYFNESDLATIEEELSHVAIPLHGLMTSLRS